MSKPLESVTATATATIPLAEELNAATWKIVDAIRGTGLDPNDFEDVLSTFFASEDEKGRDGVSPNVVDGLFAIARAIDRVAEAIELK